MKIGNLARLETEIVQNVVHTFCIYM